MKYFFSALLVLLLVSGCRPSTNPAAQIGNTVKKCCNSLSMSQCTDKLELNCPENKVSLPVSVFSAAVLERTGQILTW